MAAGKERLHTWVGALVFVVGVVFIVASYVSDHDKSAGSKGLELTARFRAVDGITIGSPVLLAGIPVGKVSKIEFDPENYSAILTMNLEQGLELPYDSAAIVASDGVFGGKYIRVEPGAEYDLLENGDIFEFTQDSIIIEELLEKIVLLGEERREARMRQNEESDGDAGDEGDLQ